jgi:hypothetical protein
MDNGWKNFNYISVIRHVGRSPFSGKPVQSPVYASLFDSAQLLTENPFVFTGLAGLNKKIFFTLQKIERCPQTS